MPCGELEEPLVVRPTSEMVIGDLFAKWIQSHRDLPVLVNQWANVVRWEMRTRMFLRTSEFLWQEGHTAHKTKEEARTHTLSMLDSYVTMCEDILAIPVIAGEKSKNERFPGAVDTFTFEAMMQDGKALQLGTSHFLGQNFAKASGIQFQDEAGSMQHAWTTSWGVTTRMIGGLIMTHSDDDGLVLPPKMSPYHVVISPILMKGKDNTSILAYCQHIADIISSTVFDGKPVRVFIDTSEKSGGEKNWHWVKKGVPLRIEIGGREVTGQTISYKQRCTGNKPEQLQADQLKKTIPILLEKTQNLLYQQAKDRLSETLTFCKDSTAVNNYFQKEQAGFAVIYWCENDNEEKKLKDQFSVTIRCLPSEPLLDKPLSGPCFYNPEINGRLAVIARSY